MKRFLVATILFFTALADLQSAEGPDAQYVRIYNLIAEADKIGSAGQTDLARQKYIQAEAELKQLQVSHPTWNDKVVAFRLAYLAEKLKGARRAIEAPVVAEKPAPSTLVTDRDEKERQIQSLSQEIQQLRRDKSVLESKLREALTAIPAAIDPRELAKAEDRIKMLEKEKDLLQVSLEQERSKHSKDASAGHLDELRKALADATRQLSQQREIATQLAREKEIIEARLQSAGREAETAKLLRSENDELRKRLGESRPVTEMSISNTPQKDPTAGAAAVRSHEVEIARLQDSLRSLQEEKATLERTKTDLETRLARVSASGAKSSTTEGERLRQVEKERDDLLKKLNDTSRQIYDNKARTDSVRKEQYDSDLAILRARLEVFEAREIPYTPEEKALFQEPRLSVTKPNPRTGRKPPREWPKGAAPLVIEAEKAWSAKRYDEAEKKFLEILRLDEKSAVALGNLAACQVEQNRLTDAEANLKRALSYEADDPHNLSLLGILKFRQEKFDEALDHLSRAAQLDPQDHQTQNYLGITLSQKGQRGPAETALRKAIQLAPGYGGAHHNLAVIYATQQPPFVELARWHYQKALASGHQQNPDLEKLIEGGRSTSEGK